jgi:hypothetical protein
MHRMSLMNIMLVVWAPSVPRCCRASSAPTGHRRSSTSGPPGGSLLGIGAALAGGCTTGGFFNPVLHSSPAGWAMWLGLLAGAAIGLKLLLWTLDNIEWGMQAPPALDMCPLRWSGRSFPLSG